MGFKDRKEKRMKETGATCKTCLKEGVIYDMVRTTGGVLCRECYEETQTFDRCNRCNCLSRTDSVKVDSTGAHYCVQCSKFVEQCCSKCGAQQALKTLTPDKYRPKILYCPKCKLEVDAQNEKLDAFVKASDELYEKQKIAREQGKLHLVQSPQPVAVPTVSKPRVVPVQKSAHILKATKDEPVLESGQLEPASTQDSRKLDLSEPTIDPDEVEAPPSRPSTLDGYEALGREIGALVERKQKAYGDSFNRSGAIMAILYPNGVAPDQMVDALCVIRILDKLFRIATDRDALGESPYRDIAGYALLGAARAERQHKEQEESNSSSTST